MTVIVVVAAVLVGMAAAVVIVVLGNRMVRSNDGAVRGGMTDGLGMALNVFDPAQGRARQELEEQKHQGAVIPSPDGDDRPMRVDLGSGRVTVRRDPR